MIEANSLLGMIINFVFPLLGKIIVEVPSIVIALIIYEKFIRK